MQNLALSRQKIKCFAIDVDGTLADYEGRIDFEAAATLHNLCDLGYYVIFVSGRTAWELMMLASYIGTTKLSVGENGGVIAVSPQNIKLMGDISHSQRAYEHLSSKIEGVEIKPTMPRFTEVVLERTFDLDAGRSVLKESDLPVQLIDSTMAYHITNSDVNKGRGLEVAIEQLGIEPSEVVAIGDSDTDIPMFKTCANSIAVGNGTEGAKKNTVYQVDSHLGEGIIEALHLTFEKILKRDLEEVFKR